MEYKSNIQEDSNYIKLLVKNVGIGTESPGIYRLNVNGNTNITGTLNVTGGITGYVTGNAGSVTYSPNRNDTTVYQVLWGAGLSNTQAYSCAAITIQSSTGTLNATTLSATNASIANNIKLGANHYFRRINLPYPVIGNNAGNGRWFVRLYQTSAGGGFAGGRIRVGGDWNWAPIMGVLEIEFGIYTELNTTSINSGQTRLSAAVASATDSLRIGNIEVVDGWVGVYIWASNSSTPYVLFDMYSTLTPSFTSTAWEANTLPVKRSTEIIGDISATTFIGDLTGTATNADTVDGYHANTSPVANNIVVRNGNGYIFGNYINMTDNGNPGGLTSSITSFITKQGDDYYRSVSPTAAMDSIKSVASGSWNITSTDTNALRITGFGNSNFTYYQSDSGLVGYTGGWASYLISNHGNGSNYYNQTIILPFFGGAPKYTKMVNNVQGTIYDFWTAENLISPVTGNGNTNYVTKFTSNGSPIANSQIYDNGTGVGIGNTTPGSYKLNVTGTGYFSTSVTSPGFFNTSDARLKDIIERDGDTIKFTWKDGRDTKIHIGYVAQEVQKTYPDQVNKGDDGMLTINYIEVLVAKIQELENRIKQLEK